MHRETEESDNSAKMQQLQTSAHNSIKSMSCMETKGTSNPEVCPDKASQVRTEDNASTNSTAKVRPYNVGLSRCTGSAKEQNTKSAATLRHTQGQTKELTYADITKDKPATTTIQTPGNNKQTTKTKDPANKQQSTNKAQASNSTKTPQDIKNPEVHDAYEQILDMLVTQLQQLRPLMTAQDQGAKTIAKFMITSVQTLMTQLAKLV